MNILPIRYRKNDDAVEPRGYDVLSFTKGCITAGGLFWLVVLRPAEIRSIKQNAYYWKVIIDPITDVGYTKDELHNTFKFMFLGTKTAKMIDFTTGDVTEYEVPKTTTKLSKKEFTEYCDKIIDYAIQEMGVEFGFMDYDMFIKNHPDLVEEEAIRYIGEAA